MDSVPTYNGPNGVCPKWHHILLLLYYVPAPNGKTHSAVHMTSVPTYRISSVDCPKWHRNLLYTLTCYSCFANCEKSPVPRNFSILGNETSIIPKLFTKSNVVSIANISSNNWKQKF